MRVIKKIGDAGLQVINNVAGVSDDGKQWIKSKRDSV